MYALKVTCKEARSGSGQVYIKAGTVVWVCQDSYGWTSSQRLDNDAVTFENKEDAEKAASTWRGHPWYYEPAKVEVVEITPIYKQVIAGYKE